MNRSAFSILGLAIAGVFALSTQTARADDYNRPNQGYENPYNGHNGYEGRDQYRHDRRMSDEAIQDRVQRALWRSLGANARSIEVRVRDHNVYLSGGVPDWNDRREARQVASNVAGVREVNSRNLQVYRR